MPAVDQEWSKKVEEAQKPPKPKPAPKKTGKKG